MSRALLTFCCTLSLTLLPWVASPALAVSANDYTAQAKAEHSGFKGFSADQGKRFYNAKQGKDVGSESCASCHTAQPKAEGKHTRTNKVIQALAPVANPERLTDPAKVEKWFKRNCNDVLARACTAQEKGDFLAYLQSVR